jgi:hypothetical protein
MTPDFSSDLSCERCQDSLPWYVANSLADDERTAVERHLTSCARCRSALEECRELALALRRASEGIPRVSTTTWAHISRQLGEQPASTVKSSEWIAMRLQDRNSSNTRTTVEAPPAALPRGRGHAIGGLVAVVALIALSAGVFSYFATHGGSRTSTVATPPPACAPSQATVDLTTHTTLSAIAPLGADDGWAVGGIVDPQHPESPPSALMLHLRNCHWAPVGAPIPHAMLNDISMVSADEGWAVGVTYAQNVTLSDGTKQWGWNQPLVLHYIHGSWQTVELTAGPKTSVEQVKMVSATEGWMLLYDGKHPTTINGVNALRYGYSARHYQNGSWTNVPLDFLKPSMAVMDLDAREPGEVWLVGVDAEVINNRQGGFVAHYLNGVWTPYVGAALDADATLIQSVSELSPTDVWVGGNRLYHFDGARWTQVSIQGVPSDRLISYVSYVGQVAMLSPTQGWAFPRVIHALGSEATQIEALRYDQGVWRWTTLPLRGAPTPLPLITRFAPSSPTQGWAIAFQAVNGYPQYVLLYYDAGAWGVVRQQS